MKSKKMLWRPGLPWTLLGELTVLPQTPSWWLPKNPIPTLVILDPVSYTHLTLPTILRV